MSERVQVHIRFRPQSEKEVSKGGTLAARVSGNSEVDILPVLGQTKKTYTFDHTFDCGSTQEDIYDVVGVPVVESVLQGYNGTILAYGQTGSGKTHTMMGPEGGTSAVLDESSAHFPQRGLIPRIVAEIFQRLEELPTAELGWNVSVSCYELYKEKIRDLIGQSDEHQDLRIREDRGQTGRGVYVENLKEVRCETRRDIFDVIQAGMKSKHVAATGMNDTSSRSHTIITLWVTQISHIQDDTKTIGRLNLVDLAGSERVEKTGAEGDRLKEAQTINLSLTLLGNVIMKLTDGKSLHIPYRDSKLTRILQDSFGGNSRTTLLCNCSPSTLHQQETVSTLGFANRAKQIKNKPRVNKEMSAQELQLAYDRAQEEIRLLKDRIAVLESQLSGGGSEVSKPRPSIGRPHTAAELPSSDGLGQTEPDAGAGGKLPILLETDELRSTVRSVMRELSETKEELFDKQRDLKLASERATFYEKRAADSQVKFSEWKAKFEREKMAADSWMRKYNDLQREAEQKAKEGRSGRRPSLNRKASNQVLRKGQSGSSLKGKAAKGDTPARQTTPTTPLSEPAADAPPADANVEEALEEARAGEARALMRERELQERVEEMQQRMAACEAAAEAAERRQQESAVAAQRLNAELERTSAEYEDMLQRQDREIAELQQGAESSRGRSGGGDLQSRLEHENAMLYEQNRENAQRLVEITRTKDQFERALKQATDKEARLMREIEVANISADVKHRLLGNKLRATKAAFQQRLLDCFSSHDSSDKHSWDR
eukprot:TRINITY_DN14609_c0_g1_i1.p1 TRINITY_DN14609_c0_g1~~TRINITY_DN14609_c0_g1_i1.p1  ORF type:complete len:792 (+),score=327.75 TRINITY_DN14609_c0_g1_i1:63-2378(+)